MSAAANLATIDRLYAAMDAGDGQTMASCYTEDAVFEDPAFGTLRDGDVRDMWRMLCARAHDLRATVEEREATDDRGSAQWVADYTFGGPTGRAVRNVVRASYVFRDGLIADHRDEFDLHAWAGQALGPVGRVLGFTPLLGPLIRRRTRGQLAAFQAAAST